MRRLGTIGIAAASLVTAAFFLVSAIETRGHLAGASETIAPPGPPTSATLTPAAGHTAVVSWGVPLSDGGSPILFYWVTTYNGKHSCRAPSPGPNSCVIGGVTGSRFTVRVRAVNAAGRSAPIKATLTHLLSQNPGNPPAAGANGSGGGPATSPTTSPSAGAALAAGGAPNAAVAADAAPGNASADTLPFTGFNLETLLVMGVGLLLAGMLISGFGSQRRRRVGGFWNWLFGI